jgi:hypothetical protein
VHLEDTASLGLTTPIGEITASMNKILDDTTHNDHPHLTTIQFVTSKMYNINNKMAENAHRFLHVSRSFIREMNQVMRVKPHFRGPGNGYGPSAENVDMQYTFNKGITGSLSGSVEGDVTGDVIGDLTGNVVGGIRVQNLETNAVTYPIVSALDSTPDGGTENLGASKHARVNGRYGYIYASKFIGESTSHLGYTSSMFITPDKFAEVAASQRRHLNMNVSGSYVETLVEGYFVTNVQLPKGGIPSQIRVDISNPHAGKQIKLFANKYIDGTTGLQIYTGTTAEVQDGGMQDIALTKVMANAILMATMQGNPYYFTIMVGPLSANDQIYGAQINWI